MSSRAGATATNTNSRTRRPTPLRRKRSAIGTTAFAQVTPGRGVGRIIDSKNEQQENAAGC
jgi:hypothetical protein